MTHKDNLTGEILKVLSGYESPVLRYSDFRDLIEQHRKQLKIPSQLTPRELLNLLLQENQIEELNLDFPFRPETRYVTRPIPTLEKLQCIYPDAYFSHQTAAIINKLSHEHLEQVYLNKEQKGKEQKDAELSQERIDYAFRNKPRITSNKTKCDASTVYLLHGKNTKQAGVIQTVSKPYGNLRVTTIERTLIDMVVRPFYSGGHVEVLAAFRKAKTVVSVSQLRRLLAELQYLYPYHQAIGFYLESARVYPENDIEQFRSMEKRFDFYLTHDMDKPQYSEEWRIYYPKELTSISMNQEINLGEQAASTP
jgi:hypothetical protein